jgi:subtilisin family serine protease
MFRALLIGAIAWIAASAPAAANGPPADARAPQPATQAAPAGGQVLVMLRLPAEHFRPGASYGGGYGDTAGRAARKRIADRVAHAHGLILVNSWPMPVLGVDCFLMSVPGARSADEVAAVLSRDPDVAWSEAMKTFRAQSAPVSSGSPGPNDPLFPMQPAAKAWRLDDLHKIATGRKVRVAVVDSRIDVSHPDLIGQIEVDRDFLPDHPGAAESHGTAVAGIIAARDNNRIGVAGIAPNARLMALRACWQAANGPDTLCDTLSLARALSFAIENNAQIINLSLSGPSDLLLGRLLDVAHAHGTLIVGAVDPRAAHGGFPASHPGVIAVASDGVAASAIGAYLAPGRDVPTTQPHARWSLVNGSSFAAAHVTGLLALVREKDPHAGEGANLVVTHGGGEVDACATLLRVSGPCAGCACPKLASQGVAAH